MSREVYIIGSDTTKFGKFMDLSHIDLTKMTVEACIADAGVSKSDIQSVFYANGLWGYSHGQHGIRGHLAMRAMGMDGIPVTNVEAACASGSLALHGAYKDILTGLYDCSLAVGVEKTVYEDKKKSMAAFGGYIDTAHSDEVFAAWDRWSEKYVTLQVPDGLPERPRSPFMDIYGYQARWHMAHYGTTQEQLAIAAVKNHYHSTLNPKAQYQFPLTVEDVLNDYIVSWPLTRSMCAPIGDGAASAIVCSETFLRTLPEEIQKRAVRIAASIFRSGEDKDLNEKPSGIETTAKMAYAKAGLTPDQIDVAEVHDASIIGEIMNLENLGFCQAGEGGAFTESGATKLGGKIPVNTSGGLISRGHPVSASGLAMINELVLQLRGEAGARQVDGAQNALCENAGGMILYGEAASAITILSNEI